MRNIMYNMHRLRNEQNKKKGVIDSNERYSKSISNSG